MTLTLRPRQALFWETYTLETIYVDTYYAGSSIPSDTDGNFQGLSVGRPTGTFLSDISCPYPPDEADDEQPFVKIFPGCL